LLSAFHVTDFNSPLQALERVSVGAKQILEEADMVHGHHHTAQQYGGHRSKILIWVKKGDKSHRKSPLTVGTSLSKPPYSSY
jgi:hypothetical protein